MSCQQTDTSQYNLIARRKKDADYFFLFSTRLKFQYLFRHAVCFWPESTPFSILSRSLRRDSLQNLDTLKPRGKKMRFNFTKCIIEGTEDDIFYRPFHFITVST